MVADASSGKVLVIIASDRDLKVISGQKRDAVIIKTQAKFSASRRRMS